MYIMCCKWMLIWWGGMASVGALAHMETMEAFAECFPKGVVNFISGPTLPHAHTHTRTCMQDLVVFWSGDE